MVYCRELPYGIGIIQGPPGTGKSRWCAEMIRPFLHSDNDEHHQVLAVTPTNGTTDELVVKIATSALKNPQTKDKIIIRLHAISSEAAVHKELGANP